MAAIPFGTRIDLQGNEVLNMLFQKQNGLPTPTPALAGAVRFNTADGRLYVCDGSTWVLRATNSDALQGLSPANLRDRSTHTGTQTAATISDFASAVRGNTLNVMGAPTGPLSMGNQRVTSLAAGSSALDAVNKQQLDAVRDIAVSAAAGIAIKAPVLAVAVTNINVASPPAQIDGVTIPTGARILLAGQTASVENGIYTRPASGALVRATDADSDGELAPGTQVFVTQGIENGDSSWALISDVAITVGTTAQGWARVPGSSKDSIGNAGAGLVKDGDTISVRPGVGITVADGTVSVDAAIVPRKVAQAVPAGASPVTISHGLNTADLLMVQVREVTSGNLVMVGTTVTGVNTVSLDFANNPVANQYRVTLAG